MPYRSQANDLSLRTFRTPSIPGRSALVVPRLAKPGSRKCHRDPIQHPLNKSSPYQIQRTLREARRLRGTRKGGIASSQRVNTKRKSAARQFLQWIRSRVPQIMVVPTCIIVRHISTQTQRTSPSPRPWIPILPCTTTWLAL